ncbi:hypothetical protein NEOLEDRAFT_1155268 [Neolentinus lepideus HHB14362 ss-1]|uniref:RNA helicase n=1 Tax=Neolentinus lepideus HHB14362 ss-1 TaxID=1314782 RepID=A0A165TM47_9AGAM|nr:hypothetical protein NEOLEDRAFT_1155268 [Neolentinus lepideus HHB14362 ss-1]
MTSNAVLNPSSMAFFPGGNRSGEEEHGYRLREPDRTSMSSLSISSSEYRSVRSSPSPPENGITPLQRSSSSDESHLTPGIRQVQADRVYPNIETRMVRQTSMAGSFDTLPDTEDIGGPSDKGVMISSGGNQLQRDTYFSGMFQQNRERMTPPAAISSSFRSSSFQNGAFISSSPVSSLGSGSQFASSGGTSGDHLSSFEAQLKASPLINDMLERLIRCELSTREIQRELGDVNRKLGILLERTLETNGRPEFKNPFSPASFPGSNNLNGVRASITGIPPHQSPPADDITQINQRLNTLTTSIGQILAIQTQQVQNMTPVVPNSSQFGNSPQLDVSNQIISPPISTSASMLGHGLPNRGDGRASSRTPNPPMRTWSAGTLDLSMRSTPDLSASLSRQDPGLRDKRRSVIGLSRRDSNGTESFSNGTSRDGGPMISKWEQLPLAAELLRSLSKFGVGPPNKIQQRALPFLLRGADIIAQAPPTQERIAAYVIPAIQVALAYSANRPPNRGPIVLMISTTVDQATQAQRMIRDLGGPIGVRSALGVGASSMNGDLSQELHLLQQNIPHVICGTPQKLHALFTAPGGLVGSEVRFLVIDEVDQLIARNLHEFVFNIVKLLPPPRSRSLPSGSPNSALGPIGTSFSPLDSNLLTPFPNQNQTRRLSGIITPNPGDIADGQIERQTALFSNTVPQDVLNLASAIQLREPVRVLVRRDGNVTHADTNQGARGLRQFYLYLAFTAGGRTEPLPASGGGLGIIGSGRSASSAETAQAREWKLDALADLFDDIDVPQAIVHVGGMTALDTVVYKLASRGLEAVPLHGDMNAGTKLAALNKFRTSTSSIMRQPATKVLVVYDVQVKAPEVSHIPLVINYDLPKAVEEYMSRINPAIASNHGRAGVVINFVTATGGDVEMLRSIECHYK